MQSRACCRSVWGDSTGFRPRAFVLVAVVAVAASPVRAHDDDAHDAPAPEAAPRPPSVPAAVGDAPAEPPAEPSAPGASPVHTHERDIHGRPEPDAPQAEVVDAVVVRRRRLPDPGSAPATRYDVEIGQLQVIPRKNAAELLMLAPGVLTTNHGGEGHAHETFMRGFAAREGQDIEFTVDGVPLNEVSNPHLHGYTDLMFLPPEVVRSVVISEGPFDPQQGDFSFAGSADYRLGVPDRGSRIKQAYGSFNSLRTLALIAPRNQDEHTFAAFEFFKTDGFGKNRAAQRASGLGRYATRTGDLFRHLSVGFFAYGARYDQPGVIRQDDYVSGRIGFYDTYDPNQGGESNRLLFTLDTELGNARNAFHQVIWAGYRTMRMRVNYTGFVSDTLVDAVTGRLIQRGDLNELRYRVVQAGARGDFTLTRTLWGEAQRFAVGYSARLDTGRSEQYRLRAVTSVPYRTVFKRDFTVFDLSAWARIAVRPVRWFTLRGGARVDAFAFGVTDLNQPASDRDGGTRVPDQTAQAFGFAINPRVIADVEPVRGFHIVAGYGHATRSTEAAALSDNETTPFATARQADAGLVYRWGEPGDAFSIKSQLSYVFSKVNKDLLFDETAGRNVLVGASTRHAIVSGTRITVAGMFDALVNVGWSRATLDATGELFPYIPQLVARVDTAVFGNPFAWRLGGVPVTGRLGVGFTYVPGRPLPFKMFGDPMYLFNLGGELRLWHVTLGLELRNLLNLRYRQSEFNYVSNFRGADAAPSRVPMRHFVAGEPFFAMATLTLHIEDLIRDFTDPRSSPPGTPTAPGDDDTPAAPRGL